MPPSQRSLMRVSHDVTGAGIPPLSTAFYPHRLKLVDARKLRIHPTFHMHRPDHPLDVTLRDSTLHSFSPNTRASYHVNVPPHGLV